jgi:hypothetical protein
MVLEHTMQRIDGTIVAKFSPRTAPDAAEVIEAIEALL